MSTDLEWALGAIRSLKAQYQEMERRGNVEPAVCFFFEANAKVRSGNPAARSLSEILGMSETHAAAFKKALGRSPSNTLTTHCGSDVHLVEYGKVKGFIFKSSRLEERMIGTNTELFATAHTAGKFTFNLPVPPSLVGASASMPPPSPKRKGMTESGMSKQPVHPIHQHNNGT